MLQQLPRLSDQRLNLFPLFDRAPRKQAMLERVLVLLRRARPRRARGLAPFDAVPELLLGGQQQMLVRGGSAGILISTHCPPPVMIDSTAVLEAVTHILCCSCGMCFSAAPSSENDQGSMNLASKTAPEPSTMPSSVAAIHRFTGWKTRRWTSVMACPV